MICFSVRKIFSIVELMLKTCMAKPVQLHELLRLIHSGTSFVFVNHEQVDAHSVELFL